MQASGSKSLPSIGFLSIQEHQEQAYVGGYLILNGTGRPLEFHCTAPVKANRAQQALYGPTLKPYLFGEQIGHTLVTKAKIKPLFVCTNVAEALAVRQLVELPVVLVADSSNTTSEESQVRRRIDPVHHKIPQPKAVELVQFSLGDHQLSVAAAHEDDRDSVVTRWQAHTSKVDLSEPFHRIREALEEAHSSAGR